MRKLLFLLLLPACIHGQGLVTNQNGGGGAGVVYSPYVGTKYAASTWSDLANIWDTSGVSATISSGKIQIAAGNSSDFTHYLSYKDTLSAAHARVTVGWHMTTAKTSNNFGLAVGFRGVNPTVTTMNSLVADVSTGSGAGRFQFFYNTGSGNSSLFTMGAGSAVPYNQNDHLLAMLEKNNNLIHLQLYNTTANSTIADTSFTVVNNNTGPFPANLYEASIFSQGSTQTCIVDSFSVQVFEPTFPDILFIGDSKTTGYGASVYTKCWVSLLKQFWPNVAIWAGGGNTTASIRASLPDIIASHPKNVILCGVGSNDLRYSISSGTWQANLTYINATLTGAGINVIWTNPLKETSLDQTSLKNWQEANLPNVLDVYTTISSRPNFNWTDGIHLSDLGNMWLADYMKAVLPSLLVNVNNVNLNQ